MSALKSTADKNEMDKTYLKWASKQMEQRFVNLLLYLMSASTAAYLKNRVHFDLTRTYDCIFIFIFVSTRYNVE